MRTLQNNDDPARVSIPLFLSTEPRKALGFLEALRSRLPNQRLVGAGGLPPQEVEQSCAHSLGSSPPGLPCPHTAVAQRGLTSSFTALSPVGGGGCLGSNFSISPSWAPLLSLSVGHRGIQTLPSPAGPLPSEAHRLPRPPMPTCSVRLEGARWGWKMKVLSHVIVGRKLHAHSPDGF